MACFRAEEEGKRRGGAVAAVVGYEVHAQPRITEQAFGGFKTHLAYLLQYGVPDDVPKADFRHAARAVEIVGYIPCGNPVAGFSAYALDGP